MRLFRRQRVELPRRDLMGEAYLVVLTHLVGDAEANRERLEDTAIPNIDDGLANARATLLVEAHAAMDEMTETVAVDLRAFNQDLPVEIRPAVRGVPRWPNARPLCWSDRLTSTSDASTSGTPTRHTPRADFTSSTTTAGPKWSSRYWTPSRWDSRRPRLSSRLTG